MSAAIYVILFVCSAFCCFLLTKAVRDLAVNKGFVIPPASDRHIHLLRVPRLGGIAIYVSFVSVALTFFLAWKAIALRVSMLPSFSGFLLAGTSVFLLGIYDDLKGAKAYLKFGVQGSAAAMLYFSGFGIERLDFLSQTHHLQGPVSFVLTVLWILLVTNAFNLIDGLDGLAAGSALFSTMVVFVISLMRSDPSVPLLTIILAGSIVGFLRFNFSPASIFLGDSGSLFIGFMLSALTLAGSQKATTAVAVAVPVISFGLPILDVAISVLRRFLGAKPLFVGDSDHIHHRLLKRGFSQRAAVLILYGVTALFGLLSLFLMHGEKMLALVLGALGIGVWIGLRQLRYHEFYELARLLRQIIRRRRMVANNINVRRAAESLKYCNDLPTVCATLRNAFQELGFDGFYLECGELQRVSGRGQAGFECDSKGRLCISWRGIGTEQIDPGWELRIQLITSEGDRTGYLSVFRADAETPLPFDVDLLGDGVRTSISDAVRRALQAMSEDNVAGRQAMAAVASSESGSQPPWSVAKKLENNN